MQANIFLHCARALGPQDFQSRAQCLEILGHTFTLSLATEVRSATFQPHVVRESQEVKRAGSFIPITLAQHRRQIAKANQRRLARLDFKRKLPEALFERLLKTSGIGFTLEAADKVTIRDTAAHTPVEAYLLPPGEASTARIVDGVPGNDVFAVSLEPAAGSPRPTEGQIVAQVLLT